jgi:hypothetical protein
MELGTRHDSCRLGGDFAKHSGDQELYKNKLKFYQKKNLNLIYQSLVQALNKANNLDPKIRSRTK